MLIITVALGGLLLGLAAALYFKRRSGRSEQEKRAKAVSKMLAGDMTIGGGSVSYGGESDGDD